MTEFKVGDRVTLVDVMGSRMPDEMLGAHARIALVDNGYISVAWGRRGERLKAPKHMWLPHRFKLSRRQGPKRSKERKGWWVYAHSDGSPGASYLFRSRERAASEQLRAAARRIGFIPEDAIEWEDVK